MNPNMINGSSRRSLMFKLILLINFEQYPKETHQGVVWCVTIRQEKL